ncbi:MAG: 50S ribosomal protein L21 [Chloroflexi bacterium GWB2_49_20]|nr:MAG: 50S ribosomal protein L21 [Chloroflexi bacterium GWB2_49_20]OGN78481.1 MAG: 50S ribosomal protein L21 [Chloroflexi bacterium GWC2_49_37]OGN84056.1 MAG: 50S ribosomal protein L21 [Chloroflexi bacterium GWD2_49_16]
MKYAIIESGGKQYKAVEGERIDVDRLAVEPDVELKLEQVLMLVDGDKVTVGTPTVTGISVLAKVVQHVKGQKLTVFKYRPKKRIRVKTGHRQTYTRLLIEQVGDTKSEKASALEKPAKVEKIVKVEKTTKAKKPAVEKTVKPVIATTAKKVATVTKTDKKPTAKKATTATKTVKKPAAKKTTTATKTVKKPAVKKTTKTEK